MEPLGLEDQIVAAIRRIMRAVDLHSKRLAEDYGLTGPQLATLKVALRLGVTPASDLARAVHLSNATVTGILTRLEKRELIRRTRGQKDRRTVLVEVTDAGKEILSHAPSLLQEQFRERLSQLEEWEQHLALAMLQRIALMMDASDLDAAPHLMVEDPDGN